MFLWVRGERVEVPGWSTALGAGGRQTAEEPQALGPCVLALGLPKAKPLREGPTRQVCTMGGARALKGPRCHWRESAGRLLSLEGKRVRRDSFRKLSLCRAIFLLTPTVNEFSGPCLPQSSMCC